MISKHEDVVRRLIMDATKEAGYFPRIAGDEVVGIIALARVCRLLEAIHVRVVEELDKISHEQAISKETSEH